jgi:hypothetical protein
MSFGLEFDPLFRWSIVALLMFPLVLVTVPGIVLRQRGALLRLLAVLVIGLAILNPVLLREDREPLKNVVVVIADHSQSQAIGSRDADTDTAIKEIRQRLSRLKQFDVRVVDAGQPSSTDDGTSTRIFASLADAVRDVPPARIGGVIMVTDGQVHDVPANLAALGFDAPVHALITGVPGESDRRIHFVRAPRFGISGKPLTMTYRVDGEGAAATGTARVHLSVNGKPAGDQTVPVGVEEHVRVTIPRAGSNIVELSADPVPGEITATNNRAVALVDGIRENLRVLLISGEPHNGERTWRNLLKSDPAVDLVHFTILRPPEKQDGTPINELSLIAFPTRELFVDKINSFDLIILDRYQHRDVLPILYYDYIAQYVRDGGALLVAAGPEYAGQNSIARTPLLPALPAVSTGEVTEKGFYPRLTDAGKRHPVTRGLAGADSEPPHWGRWFRIVDVDHPNGTVVMDGPDKLPLLILNRYGKGRVGMFLSDQGWLWARGFEGGGPDVALYRRIVHWLMKEPSLEEEALTAGGHDRTLDIRRQTMGDDPGPARVTLPSGRTVEVGLAQSEPGIFTGTLKTDQIGLFQIANGTLSALAHVGPVNAPEFADSVSTEKRLEAIAEATGGSVHRLRASAAQANVAVPGVIAVSSARAASGPDWIGLVAGNQTALKSVNHTSLVAGLLGLALLLFAVGGMWWREGR